MSKQIKIKALEKEMHYITVILVIWALLGKLNFKPKLTNMQNVGIILLQRVTVCVDSFLLSTYTI